MNKQDEEPKGIYGKYKIVKTDGKETDPKAVYFVLRLDTDPFARAAMLKYAEVCQEEAEEPGEVEVMAIVEGHVMDVRCSLCGRVRTWVPGEEALRALIESVKRR